MIEALSGLKFVLNAVKLSRSQMFEYSLIELALALKETLILKVLNGIKVFNFVDDFTGQVSVAHKLKLTWHLVCALEPPSGGKHYEVLMAIYDLRLRGSLEAMFPLRTIVREVYLISEVQVLHKAPYFSLMSDQIDDLPPTPWAQALLILSCLQHLFR